MITFRIDNHKVRPGVQVVEVIHAESGRLLATIVPGDQPDELRILSRQLIRFDWPDFDVLLLSFLIPTFLDPNAGMKEES